MSNYRYELLSQLVDDIVWNEESNIYWNKDDLAKALNTKSEYLLSNIKYFRDINLEQMEFYSLKDNGGFVSKKDRQYIKQRKQIFNKQINGDSRPLNADTKYHLTYKHHAGNTTSTLSQLFPDVPYTENTSRIKVEQLLSRIKRRLHDYEEIPYSEWAYVFVKEKNDFVTVTISHIGKQNSK